MQTDTTAIIIFARYPTAGQAKTRLIPALGTAGAALLHKRLTEHIIHMSLHNAPSQKVMVYYTGATKFAFKKWLGSNLIFKKQCSGDLGNRMIHALCTAFKSGAHKAIIMGSDIPGITADMIQQASRALDKQDLVLGPATDGGYYLIGVKKPHPELFHAIDWGTETVLDRTRQIAISQKIYYTELQPLDDVDRPEDLNRLRADPRFADIINAQPLLSIIIPTLNEEHHISQALEHLAGQKQIEVIIADGGSTDNTLRIAEKYPTKLITVPGGRALQLNAGAHLARGHYLLFLHSDTRLPEGFQKIIISTLNNPIISAGAFGFMTDGKGIGIRLVEWGTNIRSKVFKLPYGDQGIFMEKRIFDDLGGFANLPIMEDFELVRRLNQRGKVVTMKQKTITSARRWQTIGTFKTLLLNQMIIIGFLLGVSPRRLANFYRKAPRT